MPDDTRNIIILSADALRADHLSCYGYERDTSPFLDEFATDCRRFTNAHSVSSHTREAVPGLLTGRYPDTAIDADYHLAADSLAYSLCNEGFATGGFHSNPYVSRAYGYGNGFDAFDDDLYIGQNKLIALAQRAFDKLRNRHYARAAEINARSLKWLDSLGDDQPFFLWNHYMDTHGPYEPPTEFRTRYLDEHISDKAAQELFRQAVSNPGTISTRDRQRLIDLYDAEIAYNDHQIRAFIDSLRERDLLADSLVIFTADHGEAFGERGYYSHPRNLDPELTHVPLFVHAPGLDASVVDTPVSTLDIAATVRTAVNQETQFAGESLFDTAGPDRCIFQQARGEGDNEHVRRYAVRSQEGFCRCSYDINSESLEFQCDGDKTLRQRLQEHVANRSELVKSDESSREGQEPGESIERRLEALGYKD